MEKEGVGIMEMFREVLWTECGEFLQWLRNYHLLNPLKPNDIYIYMSYRSANLQTLHFKYLFNKYTY